MTEQAARTWLSSHHDIIPALEINHGRALEILEDHKFTLGDLADVIAVDPGMSVSLYHEVNGKLHRGDEHQANSVHAALSRLGDSAIADLVMQHRVLDRTHSDALRRQSYHQLISRTYHLLAQLDAFIELQGIREVNEIRSAALLHNIGEFCACLFDHGRYQKYQDRFRDLGSEANSAKPVFGFDFHELGLVYAEKSRLPALVTESLDENIPSGRKARLIQLAADVSHQAEVGWYHSSMRAAEEVCAAYLNQSIEGFDKRLQQTAIECARNSPFDDVFPAAARLIMLPDAEIPAKPVPQLASLPRADAGGFVKDVKSLLGTRRPTRAHLLGLMLDYLHQHLHLTRVALLLPSRDHRKLGTRAGRGIDKCSPIRTLVIDISRENLPGSMMAEPGALWIEPDNYRQYESSLPSRFKSAFLHECFFLMSIAIDGRPVGLVYADRALGVSKLDKASYDNFKAVLSLTGKALGYLGKQNQEPPVSPKKRYCSE